MNLHTKLTKILQVQIRVHSFSLIEIYFHFRNIEYWNKLNKKKNVQR